MHFLHKFRLDDIHTVILKKGYGIISVLIPWDGVETAILKVAIGSCIYVIELEQILFHSVLVNYPTKFRTGDKSDQYGCIAFLNFSVNVSFSFHTIQWLPMSHQWSLR